jgi:hypothetical protein
MYYCHGYSCGTNSADGFLWDAPGYCAGKNDQQTLDVKDYHRSQNESLYFCTLLGFYEDCVNVRDAEARSFHHVTTFHAHDLNVGCNRRSYRWVRPEEGIQCHRFEVQDSLVEKNLFWLQVALWDALLLPLDEKFGRGTVQRERSDNERNAVENVQQ